MQHTLRTAQAKVERKRLGSCEFRKLLDKILETKGLCRLLLNVPEVMTSSYDKARLFTMNFASNSTLDNKDQPLPVFPPPHGAQTVPYLLSKALTEKVTTPDKILLVVLKNISPELFRILVKLFNHRLKKRWKESTLCPVFKNMGDRSCQL